MYMHNNIPFTVTKLRMVTKERLVPPKWVLSVSHKKKIDMHVIESLREKTVCVCVMWTRASLLFTGSQTSLV